MKKQKITFVTAIILMMFASIIYSQNSEYDEITKSFKVNSGGILKLDVNPGDITVSTWDKEEVLVKITGIEDKDQSNVKMEQSGNTVKVNYNSKWGWSDDVKFIISIPKKFNVEMETSGGDILIKGDLEGKFDVSTNGGDIQMSNIKGNVSGNTMGGDIRSGDINGQCELKTLGGDIKLGEIKNGNANVDTYGGDISIKSVGSNLKAKTYGGDIIIGNIGGDAEVTTFGGDIKLSSVTGSAKVDTYGGDISLNSASGKVKADTKGGDITLKNITGVVDANTSAGDIYVELVSVGKGNSILKTSAGDITLYISTNAKATIEAEIKGKGSWDKYKNELKITSDFSSNNYKVDDNSKKITATYLINGGGEKITLKTTNSNIKIKKLNK